jgi:hypothetical protein
VLGIVVLVVFVVRRKRRASAAASNDATAATAFDMSSARDEHELQPLPISSHVSYGGNSIGEYGSPLRVETFDVSARVVHLIMRITASACDSRCRLVVAAAAAAVYSVLCRCHASTHLQASTRRDRACTLSGRLGRRVTTFA